MSFLRNLLIVLLFSGGSAFASSYHFDFNPNCQKAYYSLTCLRINEGLQIINQEKQKDPYNLIPTYLENYSDFLTLLLNGDAGQYEKVKDNKSIRLELLDRGPENDPWLLYTKSAVNFQWALIHIYFNGNWKAATEFRKSFILLKKNQKDFPNFAYNDVLAGMEEAVVGTLPGSYQWIAHLLGMRGSVKGGSAKLSRFLSHNKQADGILQNEAVFYYGYIRFFLANDRKTVWHYLNQHYANCSSNHLITFLKANLALNDNQARWSLKILESRKQTSDYLKTSIFDYQMGVASARLLDAKTPDYLNRFLSQTQTQVFQKSALQKLSYYYLATGNVSMAQYIKSKITQRGNTLTDADKQAQRYGESNAPLVNSKLAAAELLCDGGEYVKSLERLNTLTENELPDPEQKTAFNYRYGRVFQLIGNLANAIPYYESAIKIGSGLPGQYAARSALELGEIYEQQGDKQKATNYYNQCLSMKNKDFKANIEQKARAGLNRLGQ